MTVYRWFIPEVEDPSDITDQERNFASARWLGVEVPVPGSLTNHVWKWCEMGSSRRHRRRVALATLSRCRWPQGGQQRPPVHTVGHSPVKLLIRRLQGHRDGRRHRTSSSGRVRGATADLAKCRGAAICRARSSLLGVTPTNLGPGAKLGVTHQDDHNCCHEQDHNHVAHGQYGIQAEFPIEAGACVTPHASHRTRDAPG